MPTPSLRSVCLVLASARAEVHREAERPLAMVTLRSILLELNESTKNVHPQLKPFDFNLVSIFAFPSAIFSINLEEAANKGSFMKAFLLENLVG